jgi:hypothetical protein
MASTLKYEWLKSYRPPTARALPLELRDFGTSRWQLGD